VWLLSIVTIQGTKGKVPGSLWDECSLNDENVGECWRMFDTTNQGTLMFLEKSSLLQGRKGGTPQLNLNLFFLGPWSVPNFPIAEILLAAFSIKPSNLDVGSYQTRSAHWLVDFRAHRIS
jgi:hypothetical protein